MLLRSLATAACCALLTTAGVAQMGSAQTEKPAAKAIASPPATAEVSLNGKQVAIHYNSPRIKGRKIGSTWRITREDAEELPLG